MNAFVEATPISGPARVYKTASATRVVMEPTTFVTVRIFDPSITHLPLGSNGVRRFTGLRDEDEERVRKNNRIAISIFAGVIHFDRQARHRFDHVFPGERRMPARAASKNSNVLEPFPLIRVKATSSRWTVLVSSENRPRTVFPMAAGCS